MKHHVLGLEVVTGTGGVIHTDGKTVKNVRIDLTGPDGAAKMLGIITEATLELLPMRSDIDRSCQFSFDGSRRKVRPKFTPHGILPMAMEVITNFCSPVEKICIRPSPRSRSDHSGRR